MIWLKSKTTNKSRQCHPSSKIIDFAALAWTFWDFEWNSILVSFLCCFSSSLTIRFSTQLALRKLTLHILELRAVDCRVIVSFRWNTYIAIQCIIILIRHHMIRCSLARQHEWELNDCKRTNSQNQLETTFLCKLMQHKEKKSRPARNIPRTWPPGRWSDKIWTWNQAKNR